MYFVGLNNFKKSLFLYLGYFSQNKRGKHDAKTDDSLFRIAS